MDDLDVRLMRELISPASFKWDAKESYSSIARRLGIDEETARKRLKRVQAVGLVSGFHLVPNPHLLGQNSAAVELEVDDEERKQSAISQIELVEGVVFIINFLGKRLRVVVQYDIEQSLERRIQLIESVCASRRAVLWTERFPPCGMRMKETDWLILKSLRKDARRSLASVAAEAEISTRTVKRRFARMQEENAFFLMPVTAYEKSAVLVVSFTIDCPNPKKKEEMDAKVRSRLRRMIFSNTSANRYSIFSALCNNISEAEEIRKWMREVDGTAGVTMGIVKNVILVPNWLDEQVERRISDSRVEPSGRVTRQNSRLLSGNPPVR